MRGLICSASGHLQAGERLPSEQEEFREAMGFTRRFDSNCWGKQF